MKKTILAVSALLIIIFSLQNCKPDKPDEPDNPNDPDSLYVGTTYLFAKPFRFPTIDAQKTNGATYEGIELGRRLFYDEHLSRTGQLSCGSCHKQVFAFSDGGKAKSDNIFGPTKRNSPSIQNLLWTSRHFWDGRVNSLSDAGKDAFHGEQDLNIPGAITFLKNDSVYSRLFRKAFGRPGDVTEEKIYQAMQQFLMTLISSNSPFVKWQRGEQYPGASVDSGFTIFLDNNRGDCLHCHMLGNTLLMTDNAFHSNGLDDALTTNDYADKGRGQFINYPDSNGYFKAPSLRNIALTGPYMHDGRFHTLMDVINFYSTGVKKPVNFDGNMHLSTDTSKLDGNRRFTPQEKQYLLDFFNSLTDTTFTNNPAFQNPF
ncbi:MAG: cytochrome c peroxidase [Bacteroidota bacterium]